RHERVAGSNAYRYCLGHYSVCHRQRNRDSDDQLAFATIWSPELLCGIYYHFHGFLILMWKRHQYLGIGVFPIYTRYGWWRPIGNRTNHYYRKLPQRKTEYGTGYLRYGGDCRTYVGTAVGWLHHR